MFQWLKAVFVKRPKVVDYTAPLVRQAEVGTDGRGLSSTPQQLVLRYGRYVKVCNDRNASAVASRTLRTYRLTEDAAPKTRWRTKAANVERLKKFAGKQAKKSLYDYENAEVIDDHRFPLNQLLARPNPGMSGYELIEATQLWIGLTGNAYWLKIRPSPGAPPTELYILPAQWVEPIPDKKRVVSGYRFRRDTIDEKVYDADDIIHFKQWNPHSPYVGMGDVEGCVEDADLSKLFAQTAISMLENGAQPGMFVNLKKGNTKQAQDVETYIDNRVKGARRWGKTLVVSGELDLTPFDMTEPATKFLAMPSDKVREVIANQFGMSVALMTLDSAALATAAVAREHWEVMGVLPRAQRIEDTINLRLVPDFAGDAQSATLVVCFDAVVTKDETQLYNRLTLACGKWLTPNDCRTEAGFEELDDPSADELAGPMPAFGGPGGEGGQNPPGSGKDGEDAGGRAKPDEEKGKRYPTVGRWSDAIFGHARKSVAGPPSSDVANLQSQLAGVFNRLGAAMSTPEIVAMIASGQGSVIAELERLGATKEILAALRDPIAAIFGKGWERGVRAANGAAGDIPVAFDAENVEAVAFLDRYRIRLADSVRNTMADRVGEAIQGTIRGGGTVADATQAVSGVFGDMEGYSAERIARTEMNRALTAGKDGAWSQLPGQWRKEWLLSGNPCAVCLDIWQTRRTVPVGEPFARAGESFGGTMLDYGDVNGSDAHPQCSCGIGLVEVQEPVNA